MGHEMSLMELLMRWIHILAAVVAVGGSTFMRLVLMPAAAETLDDEPHQRLRQAVMRRWRVFVHAGIGLLLLSGFYNYLAVTRFDHKGQAGYHALIGVKILLALAVFALAIGLTSRKSWSETLRRDARRWLGLLVALAMAVVMIGGVLKWLPKVGE